MSKVLLKRSKKTKRCNNKTTDCTDVEKAPNLQGHSQQTFT